MDELRSTKVRFRAILPLVYLSVAGIQFAVCLMSLMHSIWCERFLASMFPAHWVAEWALDASVSTGVLSPDSQPWKLLNLLTIVIPFAITVAQYFFLGFLIDKLIVRRG